MLSIAVCDDEILECCRIAGKIRAILDEMGIVCSIRQFFGGKELLEELGAFDIIFLDILMEGMDGMEAARKCREKAFEKTLIFLSSSREYVFDAFDVEAFRYLVKPVDEEKLRRVLRQAVRKERKLSERNRFREYLVVDKERQKKKIFLDEVRYFEVKGRQIDVHGDGSVFTYYGKMRELEERVKGKGFFRCHKSYLVNLGHVEVYSRQEAVLDNGERVLIAKRRYEEFGQKILGYMRGSGGIL